MKKLCYTLTLVALFVYAVPSKADWGKRRLQEMTNSASLIVEAQVVKVSSKIEEVKGRSRIFTYVTLLVQKEFKGRAPDKTVTVQISGGKVGDRVAWSSTFVKATEGEEAIFFMVEDEDAHWKILSPSGKLRIEPVGGIRRIDTSLLRNDEYGDYGIGSRMRYQEIEQRINTYLFESQ